MLPTGSPPRQLRDVPRAVLAQIGVVVIGGAILGLLLARVVWAPPPLKLSL